ncbi:DUF2306 domain-containing protein [Flavihumibacter sp. RY-1]|uniref:DUF2306 domain-containing protein n=1 Tax=Flavihumibacter fluminis TaxID=2909236 RepID=A0ABS9BMA7_9BACT|nr:DUF2306 domain-containing protein [Flavihumibacter fluminis]MCF1715974.1 DUF2306 domain-containing protein [Flavihumibacter fluminis]
MKKRHLNKFLWLTLVLLSTYYLYRGPLFLLSLTWIFMTVAAWITIKNGNIVGHRLFEIRSYALALVFIFLRLVGTFRRKSFSFLLNQLKFGPRRWNG